MAETRDAADRHRTLFDHERWAHERVLASIESVPEPSRHDPDFHWAVDRMAHILVARLVWLARLTDQAPPDDLFPHMDSLAGLRELAGRVDRGWSGYLGRLDHAELARQVVYDSTEGASYSTAVDDILDHVYTHGFYHRGQVARAISAAGGERAVQDYIFFIRAHAAAD